MCLTYAPGELISPAGSDPLNGSLSPGGDTDDSGGSHSTNSSDSDFIIPELPSGSKMEINIRSTWGDRHYLGLNGIEVFSSTGEPVSIAKVIAVTDTLFKILRWHYIVCSLIKLNASVTYWLLAGSVCITSMCYKVFQIQVKYCSIETIK
jgi:hypothetical protein